MKLDLVNDIVNGLKENNIVQDFIKELSNYLDKNDSKNLGSKIEKVPIIEDIVLKNNLTTGNENAIRWKFDEVILKYANDNFENDTMYFVNDSKKTYWLKNQKHYNNEVYSVLKVENNNIEEIEISKKEMPANINVNDVFTIKSDEYIIDNNSTKILKEKIIDMAKEIINKQNISIDDYRKEGHLYLVTEEVGDKRFLRDLTEETQIEFEEVNIPKKILDIAVEGIILKYNNGVYEYYSDNGFNEISK